MDWGGLLKPYILLVSKTEIKIHRGHDAVFVAELKLELEELKARLDLMINKKQPRALSTQRRAPSIANRPNVQVAPTVAADENYGEDFTEPWAFVNQRSGRNPPDKG